MVNARLVLELVERAGAAPRGSTITVALGEDGADTVAAWCTRNGHQLVEVRDRTAIIRCGPLEDRLAAIPAEHQPGTRVWLYTNFDCNLACDYWCVRSLGRAP